jgi:hypothetical protein
MEERFTAEVAKLNKQIAGSETSHAIAKSFVESLRHDGPSGARRFDEHDFALCSRVLTQLIYSHYKHCIDSGVSGSWFAARKAFAGSDESETALGAIFQVCSGCCFQVGYCSSRKSSTVTAGHRTAHIQPAVQGV